MKKILLPSLIVGAATAAASAAIINIDVGRTATTTGGNWNNVHGPSGSTLDTPSVALIDDEGNSTGLTLDTSFANGGSWAGAGADYTGDYPAAVTGLPESALMDSMFIRSPAFVTFTLTGLDAGSTYDFLIYGARGNNGTGDVLYTITGGNGTSNLSITDAFNNSTQVATATGVTPDGSNEITLVYTTDGGSPNAGGLNVIQITTVPEPSAAALVGLAGLALARRRRN